MNTRHPNQAPTAAHASRPRLKEIRRALLIVCALAGWARAERGPVPERVETDSVWSKEVVVDRVVTVGAGAVLTVTPGTLVRFGRNAGLVVNGGLRAVGGPDAPITFTSTEVQPGPGAWEGITFEGSDRPVEFSQCTVRFAKAVTIKGVKVSIADCTLASGEAGVVVASGSAGRVTGTAVTDMTAGGIVFHAGSAGLSQGNTVQRCGGPGISTNQDCRVAIRGNQVSGCRQGIVLQQNNCLVEGNIVQGGEAGILVVAAQETCSIRGNRVTGSDIGIHCTQFAVPLVEDNHVTGCKDGIVCFRGSAPRICNNALAGNQRGLVCLQISSPRVNGNDISGNGTGVYLQLSSYALLNGNNLFENRVQVELASMMSADWEQKTSGKPTRGNQARSAGMSRQGKAPPRKEGDGALLLGSVDARGNWWGAEMSAELEKVGAEANLKAILDYFDVPTRTYEGYDGSYLQDRVDVAEWKRDRIAGTGPRTVAP